MKKASTMGNGTEMRVGLVRASTVGDGNCKDNVHGNGTIKDKFRARR